VTLVVALVAALVGAVGMALGLRQLEKRAERRGRADAEDAHRRAQQGVEAHLKTTDAELGARARTELERVRARAEAARPTAGDQLEDLLEEADRERQRYPPR
jgi:flagellar biosynthesis/type III secretory pathway M-ring protein FliF/YscJ